jgi:hypothetical protein
MPMKLNVGVCRKIGQPDYGSLGASCDVQLELSDALIFDDPAAFQQRVRQAYAACERAVDEQLGMSQQPNGSGNGHAQGQRPESTAQHNGNGNGSNGNGHSGNGHSNNGARTASEKQLTYARQLSGQIKGLGIRKLETLSQTMFGKPLAGLSSLDASGLIDCLKDIKDGAIDLQAALNGAST